MNKTQKALRVERALKLALEALKDGLWDYGPGQDEHQRCNEVIAICEAALAEESSGTEQPAQQINPETRTKDGLKYSPNYVAGYNDGLKAAQQQDPVAWYDEEYDCAYTAAELDGGNVDGLVPLYTSPQTKPWVHATTWRGLTPEDKLEIEKIVGITEDDDGWMVSRMFTLTETKLKEKNA